MAFFSSNRTPVVWVTGAGGLIGAALVRKAVDCVPGWRVSGIIRADLDLADDAELERRLQADRPDLIVHCACLTRAPQCEVQPELARRLNVEVTRRLADWSGQHGAVLAFFSTDLLFDGTQGWYAETDLPNPRGIYAQTKREGEIAALAYPGHLVIRSTLTYGKSPTGDRSFHEDMLRSVREGRRPRLFTDEFRCPIPVEETARATWELLVGLAGHSSSGRPSGIFHIAGADRLSRWEIGTLVAEVHPELRGQLDPSSIRDYQGPPRPADCSMRCDRIQPWLSRPLPGFRDWIRARVSPSRSGDRGIGS